MQHAPHDNRQPRAKRPFLFKPVAPTRNTDKVDGVPARQAGGQRAAEAEAAAVSAYQTNSILAEIGSQSQP